VTQHLLLPKIPEPISVEFTSGGLFTFITFDGDIFLGAFTFSDWQQRNNNTDWFADAYHLENPNEIRITNLDNGEDIGPDHSQYLNTDNRITDSLGRPIAAFDIVPAESMPQLILATFSTGTGDIVLTFDDVVDLVSDNKKPWAARVDSIKQTIQGVSQTGPMEISLTTNADGPDSPGDFVSYTAEIITLRNEFGQALEHVLEFPLTLIA
jgi:hypothetical protein